MNFLDAEFVQEFIRMANDGWEQGWHERNGGNLSYRVKPEEVELIKENFKAKEWQPIGTSVPNLAGEFFLVTGSGKYFRNVIIKPEDSICMIELDEKGENYRFKNHFGQRARAAIRRRRSYRLPNDERGSGILRRLCKAGGTVRRGMEGNLSVRFRFSSRRR